MRYKKYAQLSILILLLGSAELTYKYYLVDPNSSALNLALLLLLAAGITSLYSFTKGRPQPRGWRSDVEEVIPVYGYLLQQGTIYGAPANRVFYEASRAEALAREKRRRKSSY